MFIYTGIGSRETPEDILILMTKLGTELAKKDCVLRSGHASGADLAFEIGVKSVSGRCEIYTPWRNFNYNEELDKYGIINAKCLVNYREALTIAGNTHPVWDRLSHGAKCLHTRNVYQILGLTLKDPSDCVICWTKDGKASGGTGQALRLASKYNIPIFNLKLENSINKLKEFLKTKNIEIEIT